jgi:hypothetical protein
VSTTLESRVLTIRRVIIVLVLNVDFAASNHHYLGIGIGLLRVELVLPGVVALYRIFTS